MIRLVYPTDPNFGDAMSPLIVEKLSGHKVVPSAMWNADMMAVGSVFYRGDYFMADTYHASLLRRAKAAAWDLNRILSHPIMVWGSGFLQYPAFKQPHFCRKLHILALRGHYTRRILEQYGLITGEEKIAYGDPGLLFASLFGIKSNPKYDIGIIPHVGDVKKRGWWGRLDEAFQKIGVPYKMIDASEEPAKVVSEIAECSKIISSSLHGLIVSDSLGIPSLHVGLSTLSFSQKDFELKFRDYYSALGEDLPTIISGEELLTNTIQYTYEREFRMPNMTTVSEAKARLLEAFHVI